MADVGNFTVEDLERFSRDLREMGFETDSMISVGQRITDYLYEHLLDARNESQCVLVGLYKTHLLGRLPDELRALALQVDDAATDDTACLTRLALTGFEDPNAGPESIIRPLTDRALAEEPILMALLTGMGLDPDAALDPKRAVSLSLHHRNLGIFFVPDLLESEWVTEADARSTAEAMGVVSLLGIGGALPTGDLYFVFWFTKQPISQRSGDLMGSLAPAIKAALIPHSLNPFPPG